ncbi:AlkA N-terminal domain-containing protein [Desulfosarcina sp.]|uniref:AlkA N-terminal domain-containing protein n=1 Tax=Desulfosarcina sp. TaxID=2027861 RepID=UPI003970CCA0
MDRDVCDRARLARDPRFDGLFFIGVKTTGIYCRPICPAPSPRPENIVYYPSAAAAAAAGLRPCMRCRPETAPGTPAWNGTSATVSRALFLIRQGALDDGSVNDLAARLGVGTRHLRRLFRQHIGATPKALADNHRLLFAKRLMVETDMPITQAALAAGYGSLRRCNAAFRRYVGCTPSQLRRRRPQTRPRSDSGFRCTLTLSYRPPYDWDRMLAFFQERAIPGVEWAAGGTYRRTIRLSATRGTLAVRHAQRGYALELDVCMTDSRELLPVVERVRRMFDLDANPQAIQQTLIQDPLLAERIRKAPGLRLPGSWDPFETTVRAVVGQQISVKGAVTQLGRIAGLVGRVHDGDGEIHLNRFFPSADEFLAANMAEIGMPRKRKETLRQIAQLIVKGVLQLDGIGQLSQFVDTLKTIAGIGDWTAHYVAMRALGEPDAFPASDLGIMKALQKGGARPTVNQVRLRAEAWRPWRAYAAVYLWLVEEAK